MIMTVIEIAFAAMLLIGVWNRERLIAWEEKHIWSRIRRSGK